MDIESQVEMDAIEAELMDEDIGGSDSGGGAGGEFLGAAPCAELCGMAFSIVAARKGEHWNLKPAEKDAIGASVDAVLAKYIPSTAEAYGPEVALMIAATSIILPRMREQAPENGET